MDSTATTEPVGRRPRLLVLGVPPDVLERLLHPALDAEVVSGPGGAPVDVVVLGAAGPAQLADLRRFHPHAAVVAMTDHKVSEAEAVALYDAGADAVVASRPADVFVAHLRAVLRRAAWRAMS